MTIEEWHARMKGCQVLVQLLDRKAKLLGMDAPVKVEPPRVVVPETEEQRARALSMVLRCPHCSNTSRCESGTQSRIRSCSASGVVVSSDHMRSTWVPGPCAGLHVSQGARASPAAD